MQQDPRNLFLCHTVYSPEKTLLSEQSPATTTRRLNFCPAWGFASDRYVLVTVKLRRPASNDIALKTIEHPIEGRAFGLENLLPVISDEQSATTG